MANPPQGSHPLGRPSLPDGTYICGRPGTGKTHTVLEAIDAEGLPRIYRNSSMSANGLWEELEANPESTLVLDDISNLFSYKRALQVLLAALGGRAGEPRPVTYSIKGTKEVDHVRGRDHRHLEPAAEA